MPDDAFVPTFLSELPRAREALRYARELHRGQRRASDEAPFILHPLEVAALLHVTGQRLRHYEESLVMLEDTTPDHPLVCQLRFELEALRALPPRSG